MSVVQPLTPITVTTSTGKRELTATTSVDEFGYWFRDEHDTLLLHVAHGSLHSIEPVAPPVTPTAQTARDKLHAKAGR